MGLCYHFTVFQSIWSERCSVSPQNWCTPLKDMLIQQCFPSLAYALWGFVNQCYVLGKTEKYNQKLHFVMLWCLCFHQQNISIKYDIKPKITCVETAAYTMQICFAMHLICFKYSVKLHICQHIASPGCQFEQWLVLVMSVSSVNWVAQLELC